MSRRYILHVGFYKTATTYLQRKFFNDLKEFDYLGKEYLDSDVIELLNEIKFRNNINYNEENINDLKEKIEQKYNKNIIISDEGLMGNYKANCNDSLNIIKNIKQTFDNTKIIITIRKQDSILESLYKYLILSGEYVTSDKFINKSVNNEFERFSMTENLNLDIEILNWYQIYRFYVDEFGKENVLILPQEMLIKERKLFFEKICAFLEIESFEPEHTSENENKFSYFSLKILRVLNSIFKPSPYSKRLNYFKYMLRVLSEFISYKKKFFSSSDSKLILEKFAKDNKSLAEETGLDLEKYGYYGK